MAGACIAAGHANASRWVCRALTNEETFNLSIRKFLKMVGLHSQRHIEQATANAISNGLITGTETIPARMTLEIDGLQLNVTFDCDIQLE